MTWLHHKRRSATISSPRYFSCPPTAAQPVTKFCAVVGRNLVTFQMIESFLKFLIANSNLSHFVGGDGVPLQESGEARNKVAVSTLGQLVEVCGRCDGGRRCGSARIGVAGEGHFWVQIFLRDGK